jgi:hypothetical protein
MKTEITITPITDHKSYKVNGHVLSKDSNGHWVSRTSMSDMELRAFRRYEKSVIDNPRFKKHTKATFKI